MNSGMDNQKQLMVAGVLGLGCVAAIGKAMWQINAAHSAPAPVVAAAPAAGGKDATPPAATPAAAPVGAAPAGPVGMGATKLTEADLVPLPPEQLRNPFQGPTDTASVPPAPLTAAALQTANPVAASAHPGLGSTVVALARAVRPAPAAQAQFSGPAPRVSRRLRTQFQAPQGAYSPLPPAFPSAQRIYQPQMNRQTMQVASNNMGGGMNTVPPPVFKPVPLPPPTPAQIYETDAAALRSSVVVKGVLVSASSAAFVTINGVQKVVHQGDLLPGGFQVATITDTGVVVFYNKSARLNKSIALAL